MSESWVSKSASIVPPKVHSSPAPFKNGLVPPRGSRAEAREARRVCARATNRRIIDQRVDVPGYILDIAFNPEGVYTRVANQLIDAVPLRRRRRKGHWLCEQLQEVADTISPATWAKEVETTIVTGLIRVGFPVFMARVLGSGANLGFKMASRNLPFSNISLALKALIPLVCPDLSCCPAEKTVLKAFEGPAMAEALRYSIRAI